MSRRGRVQAMIDAQAAAQRPRLSLAAAAGAVAAVAATGLLGLSGWFITGAALAGVGGLLAVQAFNFLLPSAVIRFLAIVRTGARYVERVAGHEAALKALARLRPQLFDALTRSPPQLALAVSSGEASSRLVQDVDAIQTLFVRRSAIWALASGLAFSALLTAMAAPLAGLALLGVMALGVAGSVLIGRTVAEPAGRRVQIAAGVLKDRLAALEAVSPELKAYGLEGWAAGEAARAGEDHDRAQAALAAAGGWMAAWQAAATALAVGLVVTAASGAPLQMAALAALAAVTGMEAAGGLAAALHQAGAAAEAVARLEAMTGPPSPARKGSGPTPVITLDGLTLTPPMRLAVTGPSGAGKTTLAERLIGLRAPPSSEATLGGRDLTDTPPAARRPLFAYAAQDVRLLDGTVRQNLALSGAADEPALWQALEDAALAERVRAEPQGLDAPIGPNGERLSGGERRRLGLARAYLRDAPWLVLDEPTEGLDAAAEACVLDALHRRLEGTGQGLILVSHRPAPLALCTARLAVEGVEPDGRVRFGRSHDRGLD